MRLILVISCSIYASFGCGCCLFGASPPPLLSELNWSTPERAVDTYRKAFAAENASYEFLTLSNALKEKHGVGFTEYQLGRRRFLDANRGLVDLMLKAKVTGVHHLPDSKPAQVVVRVAGDGHFAEFILVNEPVAWIKFNAEDGEEIPIELPLEYLSDVLVVDGRRLAIDGLPAAPIDLPDKKAINEVRVTKRWRLLEITNLSKSLQEALKDQ